MATLAWINLDNGEREIGVNIHRSVGNGGTNAHRDVLLIQALLNYIGKNELGLGPDYKLPDITGAIDAETYSAIGEFQLKWGSRLFAKGFGWRIDPANYKNRRIRLDRRLMAITLLHVLASKTAKSKGDALYTEALAQMNPELDTYLDGGHFVKIGRVILEKDIEVTIGPIEIEQEVEVTIGRVILE